MSDSQDWPGGDFVAAVINDRNALNTALEALRKAGFHGDEIRVFQGERGAEELRTLGGEGLLGTLRRAVADNVGAAKELLDRHESEATAGNHVLVVRVTDEEAVATVRDILAAHQAHDMVGHVNGSYEAWGEGNLGNVRNVESSH